MRVWHLWINQSGVSLTTPHTHTQRHKHTGVTDGRGIESSTIFSTKTKLKQLPKIKTPITTQKYFLQKQQEHNIKK